MKILSIIKIEILQGIRDVKTFLIMILMPTILTLLLAIIFENDFSNDIDLSSIKASILIEKSSDKALNQSIFTTLKNLNIDAKKKESIKDINLDTEVMIKQISPKNIVVYYSEKNTVYGNILASIINKYTDDLQLLSLNSNDVNQYNNLTDNKSYINLKLFKNNRPTSSLDYYGIAMIILTILFSSVTGAYKIIRDRELKTLQKLLIMPINFSSVLVGKLIGSLFISLLQISLVLVISKLFIKVNWGNNLILISLILLSLSSFSIAFGMFLGNFIKDNKSCWITLLSIIMTWGLIGGSFIPLDMIHNRLIKKISIASPITYMLDSIFNYIYLNNSIVLVSTSILFLLLAAIFIQLSSIIMEVGE